MLHLQDQLDAEVLVTSSFVSGRLAMSLFPSDLEEWSRALESSCCRSGHLLEGRRPQP
ncbi:DUF5959 family protein [Streptomyces cinerochromogenes]|uniref:DUF5959 family protein n=1 Tax=Streptomyces cinerochromogenes TaxID=66422 RepID=UPI0036BFBFF4